MAKHVTQWTPDTCGCVLQYEWDDDVSEDERVHTPVANGHVVAVNDRDHVVEGVKVCKAHQAHGDHHKVHAQVVKENSGKNRAHARLIETMPHLTREVDQGDGTTRRELHPNHAPTFTFNSKRELVVNVKGVKDADVATALADLHK